MNDIDLSGGFTMPGETGHEALCLKLARQWGADMIRDSDGTALSPELTAAGMGVYSTICVIRGHNDWIKANPHTMQQAFLCTGPITATSGALTINLMKGFYAGQFRVNGTPESVALWQAHDRTTGETVTDWTYDPAAQTVTVNAAKWHSYTVNFLAWRVWEEISMYNHTTNGWETEPLMQLDPVYTEARAYLRGWLDGWCKAHPDTAVVRFTSLFYNFAWVWGEDKRGLFSDWGSYNFAVSPAMLKGFAERYGYALTAEDFTRGGRYRSSHLPADSRLRDFISYVSDFVRGFAKELVDVVHSHGKKAYVFCDDSWIGLEPYNGKFEEFGFDGFIKCLFSGYEARFCAGVPAETREIRLHPYLFPVGLGGLPTFSKGGDPAKDAMGYWRNVRRALLRKSVDRAGLGGYPSLAEPFPAFIGAMTDILRQFRVIKRLHAQGAPYALPIHIAVLTGWGKLRTWTLSGHFHETDGFALVHVLEALSGLPVQVAFIGFDDAKTADLSGYNVIINAGRKGDAWSGGGAWLDTALIERITAYVHGGGVLLGVDEPSAAGDKDGFMKLSHVLGVDIDDGRYASHGRLGFTVNAPGFAVSGVSRKPGVLLTDDDTEVLAEDGGSPLVTVRGFGGGKGVYLSSFTYSAASTRFLLDLLVYATGVRLDGITDSFETECAVFPAANKAVLINQTDAPRTCAFSYQSRKYETKLAGDGFAVIDL